MRKDLPGRLLRLLSLLQSRREWSGAELAERLGVTDRTVRRDIDRLRELDYPVESAPGTGGGYRLVSGRNLPPLLLDDDEAVAIALGLATGAQSGVAGLDESAVRALAKLEQVLPARLRPRLAALGGVTAAVPYRDAPAVDPAVLAMLASCCRDRRMVAFGYRPRSGEPGERRVEPHHLVTVRGHWYLVAYDPDRAGWRTFRVDRIDEPLPSHRRFSPRPLPEADPAHFLARSFAEASYRHTARLLVRMNADELRERLFVFVPGEVEARGEHECTVRLSAESPQLVVQFIAAITALGAEVAVDAPEEIRARVRELGGRLLELASGGEGDGRAR